MNRSEIGVSAIPDSPEERLRDLGPGLAFEMPFPGRPPLVIRPDAGLLAKSIDAASDWFASQATEIDLALIRYGAILFRGFPLADTDAFARFVSHYPPHRSGYVGGATPRGTVKGAVYEATQVPAQVSIPLHQEMAYLHDYPVKLAFFCQCAPDEGGATTVGDFRRFVKALPDRFLAELRDKGVTYHRNFRLPGVSHPCDAYPAIYHATLLQGFGTSDPSDVEAACAKLGMVFEWESDGSLSTHLTKDAFAAHPLTKERIYFNHVLTQIAVRDFMGELYEPYLDIYDRAGRTRPYHVTYGDGSEIDLADHALVSQGLDSATTIPGWCEGDVLLIDNLYTGHGRTPYRGIRNVQVALID